MIGFHVSSVELIARPTFLPSSIEDSGGDNVISEDLVLAAQLYRTTISAQGAVTPSRPTTSTYPVLLAARVMDEDYRRYRMYIVSTAKRRLGKCELASTCPLPSMACRSRLSHVKCEPQRRLKYTVTLQPYATLHQIRSVAGTTSCTAHLPLSSAPLQLLRHPRAQPRPGTPHTRPASP
jgi:hypothetical protein